MDPTLPHARTEAVPDDGPAAARAAMVARLEAAGALRPGPVRDALRALPREVLMPQAYVRRSRPDEKPPVWDLLDRAVAAHRDELLGVLYGGESVLIQHAGEPVPGRVPGQRSGGSMTAMSSTVAMTADLLQRMDLRPGQRLLDIGTGAGVTAAVGCALAGDTGVVSVDRDPHVTAAARDRLAALGYRPTVVTGEGRDGCLVRNWAAADLVIGAPACGSWVTARPDGAGGWTVTACGPREIRAEIQDTATRWRAAGSPASYRLHLEPDGDQWVGAGRGGAQLCWRLTAIPEQAAATEAAGTRKDRHPSKEVTA
ncbi:hypothetical protein [Streptomyces subrutilus]|uniref:Protein-L-isoaspartate O-methyltransferase n=1 Tax=Streptomyces subrutilus TaxID=36818 RepID=A0A1E5PZQ4_9ACTN|nr:hypothetical protein [Streptomyces subrutilus]OEJ35128.1 hypothetical protein BGK67_30830 [Streptomyces subrutilus]